MNSPTFVLCICSFHFLIIRDLNSRADLLAKGARMKSSEFSHVNILVPPELAQTNLFEPI